MPLYEYQCDRCDQRFEAIRKFADPPVEKCPSCGGTVRKLFSSPAIQFKGSGFYITDYPKKEQPASSKSEGGESKDAAATKDTSDKGKSSSGSESSSSSSSTAAPSSSPTKD